METKTLDNQSMASHALGVTLSEQKLKVLEPKLYTWWGKFFNWRLSLGHREKLTAQEVFSEHLRYGDVGPALVMQTDPVRVAAYASELDAVVMLSFEPELATSLALEVGQRLLCVCTYEPMPQDKKHYASDIIPGPNASGHFRNAAPLIADLMSDGVAQLELFKNALDPQLWAHVASLAKQHLEMFGGQARSGRPIHVCFDVA